MLLATQNHLRGNLYYAIGSFLSKLTTETTQCAFLYIDLPQGDFMSAQQSCQYYVRMFVRSSTLAFLFYFSFIIWILVLFFPLLQLFNTFAFKPFSIATSKLYYLNVYLVGWFRYFLCLPRCQPWELHTLLVVYITAYYTAWYLFPFPFMWARELKNLDRYMVILITST